MGLFDTEFYRQAQARAQRESFARAQYWEKLNQTTERIDRDFSAEHKKWREFTGFFQEMRKILKKTIWPTIIPGYDQGRLDFLKCALAKKAEVISIETRPQAKE